ncbi:PAS domain S-box protein [Massilia sp. R2A-15]|uniref:PAS domain-containing hybrid sensor histidine kinase/response regulator n=1 Tax=Massilia sp. R2A-15 TaxID=3064278 RepID=UPI002734DA57|nr:ATP-binding protein [Massilia sp. R2A-15]WLI90882.1 PAS domain S-box protein [Massilia sp. R2A-15]
MTGDGADRARMDGMLEHLADAFCAVDPAGRITCLNRSAADLLAAPGMARADLEGRVLWDLPDLEACHIGPPLSPATEFFHVRLERWFELRCSPSPDGTACLFLDITARKAGEQAIVAASTRLHVALEAGRLGDWRWDARTDRFTLGARAAELFGLEPETPLAWDQLRERLHGADRDMVRDQFRHAMAHREDLDVEFRVDAAGGPPRWISVVGRADYADRDRQRSVLGMTGVVQDISARKNAEDTLRESEEVLRALANSIPQLAWMAVADGHIVWYNERWYEYTGTTPEQMAGWDWQSVHDPEVLPLVRQRWKESIRTGNPFDMEFPIRGADGQFRWFLTRVNAVRDRQGNVVRWFGTNTDVDQDKRVQQALRDESNVLELLNSTGSALARQRDLRSLLQTVADAATGISGARFGAFVYNGADSAGEPFTLTALAGAATDEFAQFAGAAAQSDGVVRWGDNGGDSAQRSFLEVPVVSRSGEVLGRLLFGHPEPGVFTERTERIVGGIAAQAAVAIDNTRLYEAARRAAEERKELLESERLARAEAERTSQMKDEFLATLSHELRTPLSAILGWAQVLRRGTRDAADLQRGLQTIERNARAQAQLIEDLLDMSRITSGKVMLDIQTLAPSVFVDAAIETLRPAAEAKNIRLEKDYDPATGMIAGDPARLQQVVWNLLSNAIKFTPRDGLVRLGLRPAGGNVEISVADSGAGIAPEFITHVFERFRQGDSSTTRQHGGLGLGLSIVKHLIEQHGGTVRVESGGAECGATFTVELPAASAQVLAARADRAPYSPPSPLTPDIVVRDLSNLKVLVVDDEADARDLIKRILSDCHASVTTAPNARAALEAFRAAPPDVMISDLGMPEMDGFGLLAEVRALAGGAAVPAIALTAFARSEDRLRALEAGFAAHISKPVEPSQLIATVADISGRPQR